MRFAPQRWPAASLTPGRREVEQVSIHAQAGDDAEMAAYSGEEFERGKRTIGDQDDGAIGKPAADLQGGLAGPIEQGLGLSGCAGIEALGRSQHGEERQR